MRTRILAMLIGLAIFAVGATARLCAGPGGPRAKDATRASR